MKVKEALTRKEYLTDLSKNLQKLELLFKNISALRNQIDESADTSIPVDKIMSEARALIDLKISEMQTRIDNAELPD